MTRAVTRVVTLNANDRFIYRDKTDLTLTGICIDLWKRTSIDLNIDNSVTETSSWEELLGHFENKTADVVVERMTEGKILSNFKK